MIWIVHIEKFYVYLLVNSDVLQLVSSSENLPCGSVVVVGGVIGDDGAGAHKVIVLVEKDASPGELSWR